MSPRPMSATPDDAFESLVTLNRALLTQHLLRGIAHDLRNQLQVLTLGGIAPGAGPPAVTARLEQAVDEMTTTLDLLGSLGRMEPDRESASDLGVVIGDLVRRTDLMRNLPDCRVEVDSVPPGLTVAMPPSILTQILLNVVANAKDASPTATAAVRVRVGECRATRIEVIVEDAGSGLPADAGQRWATSGDRRSHGGIGYSVVMGLLGRHGGEIRHQTTTVNQVIVTLPLTGPG